MSNEDQLENQDKNEIPTVQLGVEVRDKSNKLIRKTNSERINQDKKKGDK